MSPWILPYCARFSYSLCLLSLYCRRGSSLTVPVFRIALLSPWLLPYCTRFPCSLLASSRCIVVMVPSIFCPRFPYALWLRPLYGRRVSSFSTHVFRIAPFFFSLYCRCGSSRSRIACLGVLHCRCGFFLPVPVFFIASASSLFIVAVAPPVFCIASTSSRFVAVAAPLLYPL